MRQLRPAGLLMICCAATGCALDGDDAALEARLRQYEDRVATLSRELKDVRQELTAARREKRHLREAAADSGHVVLASEQAEVLFRAEGLRINALFTGGIDKNGEPGDEVLNVLLFPYDSRGEPIKLPGHLTIELMDPALEGKDKTIGLWAYSPAEVRDAWHNGLFSVGFKFPLTWQTPPAHETLVIHANLKTADDRSFHATDTVTVHMAAKPPHVPES